MKDKVAQRERTEELVGGARTFNEFVKERAQSHNLTPACVRSLPEIKEEWKQLKAKQLAEKKAEKARSAEAKKAEKKALADAKKAEKKASKKATVAVVKEKTAIKKVAKKASADAENIKMVLVEKAKASVPPAEPKVKGRPKKYATPEEARRAKIEATKVLNKAKKEAKKASAVANKATPAPRGQQGQPVFVPIHLRKNGKKTPAYDELERWAEEDEREQMGAEDMSGKKQRARQRRVARQRKENETMGMEDEDVPTHFDPDVKDAELKVYMAKTPKDLDGVLSALRRAEKKYDKLDKYNKQSYDHTLQVYANKRQKEDEMFRQARENLAMFKKAKANAPQRRKEKAENEAMGAEDINRARKTPKPKTLKIKRRNVGQLVKNIPYTPQFPTGRGYTEGSGAYNPDDLKEFNNYGKIQEHLGQHLNDLKEAIDPKDLRDYIHFTKEKARLKSKLVGGLVRMVGGMEGQDLFGVNNPETLEDTIINGADMQTLVEMLEQLENSGLDVPHIINKIRQRIHVLAQRALMAQNAPRVTKRKNLFGKGLESDSDSSSDSGSEMEGGYHSYVYAFNPQQHFFGTPKKDSLGRWVDPSGLELLEKPMWYTGGAYVYKYDPKQYFFGTPQKNALGQDVDSHGFELIGGGDFFGNIARAFTDTWNKPATDQEKKILKPIFQGQKILTDNVIAPFAPPVAKIADAQRRLLEDKYL